MILSALRGCIGNPRETERFGRTALQRATVGWANGRDHLAGEDHPFPKFHSLRGRILTLPQADDSVSLFSFGGEGWGEEAVTPGGSCCPCLPQPLCPSPQPSPPA